MEPVAETELQTRGPVVFQQGDEVIFGQVKAGKAAQFTRGSNRWEEFENQARRTQEAASAYSKENQVSARVRYFVDDISEEATEFLRGLDIDMVSTIRFYTNLSPSATKHALCSHLGFFRCSTAL